MSCWRRIVGTSHAPILSGAGKVAARELPGGQLACAMLRGEQCALPAVLQGYGAVSDWIERND
jgi:hypothetical protein